MDRDEEMLLNMYADADHVAMDRTLMPPPSWTRKPTQNGLTADKHDKNLGYTRHPINFRIELIVRVGLDVLYFMICTLTKHSLSRCLPFREIPPNLKDLLSLTPGKQVCGPHDENQIDTEPDLSADEDRRSTKKRRLSSVKERHRFSSSFSSDEDTATGDEISSYTSYLSESRPTSADSTGFEGDTRYGGKMEAVGEHRKGEIVGERDMKQGCGRPRKQYLVQWWVDAGYLTAPELVENWKEKKASKCRR